MVLVFCQFDCSLGSFLSIAALLRRSSKSNHFTRIQNESEIICLSPDVVLAVFSFPVTKFKADSNCFNVENSMYFAEDL